MSDNPKAPPNPIAGSAGFDREYELARLRIEHSGRYVGQMIWIITLIAGLIAITVVVSVVAFSLFGNAEAPEVLTNWGGIILGFYFGQFVNLVRDYMGVVQASTSTAPLSQYRAQASSPPPPHPTGGSV